MSAAKELVEVIPGYSTTEHVAEYLGLTVQYVRRLQGELGAVPVGGTALIYPAGRVKRFAARPRPKPGWRKGRPRKAAPP